MNLRAQFKIHGASVRRIRQHVMASRIGRRLPELGGRVAETSAVSAHGDAAGG